jgi:hypothetical protein
MHILFGIAFVGVLISCWVFASWWARITIFLALAVPGFLGMGELGAYLAPDVPAISATAQTTAPTSADIDEILRKLPPAPPDLPIIAQQEQTARAASQPVSILMCVLFGAFGIALAWFVAGIPQYCWAAKIAKARRQDEEINRSFRFNIVTGTIERIR